MTINEAQLKVDQWIKTIGVRYFNELTNMVILAEEVGEFASLVARIYGEQSFKKTQDTSPQTMLEDEMGDILFVLICLANQMGIDLTTALQSNLDKKSKRDVNRHLNNPKLDKQ
jgi:NTP pyrophosphatase (non-canonical NTP hydrolase)